MRELLVNTTFGTVLATIVAKNSPKSCFVEVTTSCGFKGLYNNNVKRPLRMSAKFLDDLEDEITILQLHKDLEEFYAKKKAKRKVKFTSRRRKMLNKK